MVTRTRDASSNRPSARRQSDATCSGGDSRVRGPRSLVLAAGAAAPRAPLRERRYQRGCSGRKGRAGGKRVFHILGQMPESGPRTVTVGRLSAATKRGVCSAGAPARGRLHGTFIFPSPWSLSQTQRITNISRWRKRGTPASS